MSKYLKLLDQADKLEQSYHEQILALESKANPSFSEIQSVNQIMREASSLREDAHMITTEHGY